jgi:hypothetical protein
MRVSIRFEGCTGGGRRFFRCLGWPVAAPFLLHEVLTSSSADNGRFQIAVTNRRAKRAGRRQEIA